MLPPTILGFVVAAGVLGAVAMYYLAKSQQRGKNNDSDATNSYAPTPRSTDNVVELWSPSQSQISEMSDGNDNLTLDGECSVNDKSAMPRKKSYDNNSPRSKYGSVERRSPSRTRRRKVKESNEMELGSIYKPIDDNNSFSTTREASIAEVKKSLEGIKECDDSIPPPPVHSPKCSPKSSLSSKSLPPSLHSSGRYNSGLKSPPRVRSKSPKPNMSPQSSRKKI